MEILKCSTNLNKNLFFSFCFIFFFLKKCVYLIFQFQLHWVFIAARGLSLVAGSRRYYPAVLHEFLIAVASLVLESGLQRAWAQQLWCRGLAALRHVESSQSSDQTHISCIGRLILNHWTTRKVHFCFPFYFVRLYTDLHICLFFMVFTFIWKKISLSLGKLKMQLIQTTL